jgi:hypothetical protein
MTVYRSMKPVILKHRAESQDMRQMDLTDQLTVKEGNGQEDMMHRTQMRQEQRLILGFWFQIQTYSNSEELDALSALSVRS